jgi:hypothetical protein
VAHSQALRAEDGERRELALAPREEERSLVEDGTASLQEERLEM